MNHGLKEICFDLKAEEEIISGACAAQQGTKGVCHRCFQEETPGTQPLGTHPLLLLLGQGHVQEVILRVAIEGATEAHGILGPSLVHLQVEPQSLAIVEKPHAHVGPHPQEHGGQPPDLKGVWAQNHNRDVGSSADVHPTHGHQLHGPRPYPASPAFTPGVKPCQGFGLGSL